ncbi:MAG: arabinan endo-1,5-alpha-L-arabinosidase [Anaerolineae bacterium]
MRMSISRRKFLQSALLFTAGVGVNQRGFTKLLRAGLEMPVSAQGAGTSEIEVTGAITDVHDPVIIQAEDAYYLFCTGEGIPIRQSTDLRVWSRPFPPLVFAEVPAWAQERIPGARSIWAPDIAFFNGKYHLYYSVSTFGSNRSVIGLATNTTLNYRAGGYRWVDEGLVIESTSSDPYNCIDPNLILDADGVPWLAFGSFWTGLKMRRLDYDTGKPSSGDTTVYDLARRPAVHDDPIEAPFILHKGDYYYLFASFDFCCRGVDSTYYAAVGRSDTITGPYFDRDGVSMLEGGGTQVTFPTDRWRGPGHCSILQTEDADYIVYHAYDVMTQGGSALRINRLTWGADGWPFIAPSAP